MVHGTNCTTVQNVLTDIILDSDVDKLGGWWLSLEGWMLNQLPKTSVDITRFLLLRVNVSAMCLCLVSHGVVLCGAMCEPRVGVCRQHFQHLSLLSNLNVQWHTPSGWLQTLSRWLFDATGSGTVSVGWLQPVGALPLPPSKLVAVLLPLGMLLLEIGAAVYMQQRWVHFAVWEHQIDQICRVLLR
jgi:hypothetical protein